MTIKLSNGLTTTVDPDDYERFGHLGWWYNGRYAYRQHRVNGKKKNIYLHRLIMGSPRNREVDHVNGDSLDNRRANLRTCTHAENIRNQRPKPGKLRGVKFDKRYGSYYAHIRKDYKRIHIGTFKTAAAAAQAYNEAARKYFGKFAVLNEIP